MAYQIGYKKPPTGKGRRTINRYRAEGKTVWHPLDMLPKIKDYKPPYSAWLPPDRIAKLTTRDKALASFYVLSCCRVSEPLIVKRGQVDLRADKEFILVRNLKINKTRKKTKKGLAVPPFYLTELPMVKVKSASLYPFTEMFLDHLEAIDDPEELIFPIGDRRAREIITTIEPYWFPHFIRSCMLTHFLNTLRNPILVAQNFGVRNLNTFMKYYNTTWRASREEFLE